MYIRTKIKMTNFSLESMQAQRQRRNIFKVLKEKKVKLKFYKQQKYLSVAKVNTNTFRCTNTERIHHQQTYTTKNIGKVNSSDKWKIIKALEMVITLVVNFYNLFII